MSFRTAVPHILRFPALLVLLQAPATVRAGPSENARFLVHLTTPVSKNTCGLSSDPPNCLQIETRGQVGNRYFAYLIISNTSATAGLSGAQFGITYDNAPESGVDVSSWTSCALVEYPSAGWPAAGTGNLLIWSLTDCHPPTVDGLVMAVAGYFDVSAYTPDELRVTRRPSDNKAVVVDCGSLTEDVLYVNAINPFGWATFSADGSVWGSNPCGFLGGGCHVSGPTQVDAGQTGIQYTMDPVEVAPHGSWAVSGNAQITSSNSSGAMVDATDQGTFWIRYQRESGCVEGCGCAIEVRVGGPTPVKPTTWGRIKTTFATTEPK